MCNDCDFLADIPKHGGSPGKLCFHAVQRPLRQPTDEERREFIQGIQLRHRTDLWRLLSRGIRMRSTIPGGTVKVNPIVQAIEANYLDADEEFELSDPVIALLWARVDPNEVGAPRVSPLGQAIRSGDDTAVEQLLKHRADPSYREHEHEAPIFQAITVCSPYYVRLLLTARVDPLSKEHRPTTTQFSPQRELGMAKKVHLPERDEAVF